jgi:hypothetical protein
MTAGIKMSVSVIMIFRLIFDFIQQYVHTELTKTFAILRLYNFVHSIFTDS